MFECSCADAVKKRLGVCSFLHFSIPRSSFVVRRMSIEPQLVSVMFGCDLVWLKFAQIFLPLSCAWDDNETVKTTAPWDDNETAKQKNYCAKAIMYNNTFFCIVSKYVAAIFFVKMKRSRIHSFWKLVHASARTSVIRLWLQSTKTFSKLECVCLSVPSDHPSSAVFFVSVCEYKIALFRIKMLPCTQSNTARQSTTLTLWSSLRRWRI